MLKQTQEHFFLEFLSELSILVNKSYTDKSWKTLTANVENHVSSKELPIFKHLIQSLEALKNKEKFLSFSSRTLEIIQQINVEVSSLAPLDKILQLSCDRLRSISKADLVFISLLTSTQQVLRIHTTSGQVKINYNQYEQSLSDGISAEVATTKEIFMCTNISLEGTYNDPFIQLLRETEKIESFIAAPLIVNNEFIGIIYSARKRPYISSDFLLTMMTNYCSQTAVAVQNAKLYTNEQRLLNFHVELIDEVLSKDHHTLLNKLYEFTNHTFLLLDEIGNKIASNLEEPVIAELKKAFGDTYQLVLNLSEMKPNANGHLLLHMPFPIQVFPVSLNEVIVAFLILPHHLDERDFINLMAIEQAKNILALKVSQEKVRFEVENRLRQNYIYDLISGLESEDDLLRRGRHLKFPFQTEHYIITIAPFLTFLKTINEKDINYILEKIQATLDLSIQKSSLVHAQKLIILSPIAQTSEIVNQVKQFSPKWIEKEQYSIGISNIAKAPSDFAKAFEESKKAAIFAQEMSSNKVFYYKNLGVIGLLFEAGNPQSLIDFRDKYLGSLIAYEKQHNSELISTLQSYLNHESVVQTAAAELHVHYNTVRYRLTKIEEITELSLSNSYHRLNMQIALAIYQLISN